MHAYIGPFSPPSNIHISKADFFSRALTFKWSPATSDCSSNNYTILSSNCGSCPTTTTNTTVTCTDVYSDGGVCTFAVQTTNMIFCRTPWPSSRSELITLMLSDIKKGMYTSNYMFIIGLIIYIVYGHRKSNSACMTMLSYYIAQEQDINLSNVLNVRNNNFHCDTRHTSCSMDGWLYSGHCGHSGEAN